MPPNPGVSTMAIKIKLGEAISPEAGVMNVDLSAFTSISQ
jgi:hypothetical protein